MSKKKVSQRRVRRPDPQSPTGIRQKVKAELGYMKKGATVLPHVVKEAVKERARAWWEEKKEEGRQMRLAEREAKEAEKEAERTAYKETMVAQARQRGIAKAKKRAEGGGAGGILAQLGQAGRNISVADSIGLEGLGQPVRRQRQNGSSLVSSHIFEGLGGFGQPQSARHVVVHHIHHHAKKKRRS